MCHELRDGYELDRLRRAMVDHLPGEWSPLLAAVSRLPSASRLRLMDDDAIFAAIGAAIDQALETEPDGETLA